MTSRHHHHDRLSERQERIEAHWPCIHGTDCDGTGLDCGPDQRRKVPAPKTAAELADIRARAWATRRANYGPSGHNGSYAR